MKNDQLSSSNKLSVVCCLRKTKSLPFTYLPTLAFAIVLSLLVTPFLSAQQRWERTYGDTSDDWAHSVQQTTDGGYIVAGLTFNYGNSTQVYLVKTNAIGETLWTRNYGGVGEERGRSVQQTSDGGYIVAGETSSFGNFYQLYLIKTNATGDTLWTRNYGGPNEEQGFSVKQTLDGGYIFTGMTASFGNEVQVYLVKTNASGDTLWTRTYGGTKTDWAYSVQQTMDGGYIVAGSTASFGNGSQFYLIKTNARGDTLWTRNHGGWESEQGTSVQQTTDGGYIVAGGTNSFGNAWQVYLIKTNASGDTLWTRNYGGSGTDRGNSVQQTSDGGYIIAGYTFSYGNHELVYIVKTNATGDTLWTRTYGGVGWDEGSSVQQTSDGGYIVAGITSSFGNANQVYLIKTDANGNVGTEKGQGFEGSRVQGFKITPNPFISFATVPGHTTERFSLYDISGRKVGTYRGDRVGEGLGPGVYFVCEGTACRAPTSTLLRIVKVR